MSLLVVQWGPLSQFLFLFALLVTLSTVVYHGLRRESVKEIVLVGLSRAALFITLSLLVFGLGGYLLAEWL